MEKTLKKATEDSNIPTPGYMFGEICEFTLKDAKTLDKCIAFFIERVRMGNAPSILYKSFKLIKYLCESGHPEFQKQMQRQTDHFRQFVHYRGYQDKQFGDKLNEKVREAAREAIDSLFGARKDSQQKHIGGKEVEPVYYYGGKESHTAQASPAGPGAQQGTFQTGKRVEQATTHSAPMPESNKWAQHMGKHGVKMGGIPMAPPKPEETDGSWVPPTAELASGFDGGDGGSGWKFAGDGGASAKAEPVKTTTRVEQELDRIVAMKAAPQRMELTQLAGALDEIVSSGAGSWDEIAEVLDGRLSAKVPWQSRLNIMTVVEHLVRSMKNPIVTGYFKENPEDVQRNVHVVQSSLKAKAQAVLKALGVEEKQSKQLEAQTTSSAASHGELTWTHSVPQAPTGGDGLDFSGLNVRSGGSSRSPAPEQGGSTSPQRTAGVKKTGGGIQRRRQTQQEFDEPMAPVPAGPVSTASPTDQQGGFGSDAAWGQGFSDGNGQGTGNGGSDGMWAAFPATFGDEPTAAPPTQQQAPRTTTIDDIFGDAPAPAPAPQQSQPPAPAPPQQQPVPPQQQTVAPPPPPSPPAQPVATPQPPAPAPPAPQPPAAAAPPVAAASGGGAVNPQVMQMMQMQQTLLSTIAAQQAQGLDVTALQAMLMQQQQLLASMLGAPAAPATAPATAPAPQPPAPQQPDAFNFVEDEMKRHLGQK